MRLQRVAVLGMGVVFMLIAYTGHALAPGADVIWLVFGFFGIAAIPGAFVGRGSEGRFRPHR